MFKLNRQFKPKRDGISIIEVLTSMAVATIGVFGVMVMIPFAVKQSQSGLDADAANNVGRNAVEDVAAHGLLQVNEDGNFERLVTYAVPDGTIGAFIPAVPVSEPVASLLPPRFILPLGTDDFAANHRAPGTFHFDPIGFNGGLTNVVITDPNGDIEIMSATASRNGDIDLDLDLAINVDTTPDLPSRFRLFTTPPTISAIARSKIPFTSGEASQLCRSEDELIFDDEVNGVEDVAPAQPIFDVDGTNRVQRQSGGRISWSAFMVPEKDSKFASAPLTQLRASVLVYRDRFVDPSDPVGSNYGLYLTNMQGFGFSQSVNQITLDPSSLVPTDTIFRGDWVMLVNRIPEADSIDSVREQPTGNFFRAAASGYRLQIMFARVTRVSDDGSALSIDGGSFDFVTDGIADPTLGGIDPGSSLTYMVHLRNVVNVYERSISVEK